MNPRFIGAVIATFLFIFAYDFVYHGIYLADIYQATAQLWRPEADMAPYMKYLSLGQALVALGVVWIVFRTERGGWAAGAMTGLALGVIGAGTSTIFFAVQPLPSELVCSWISSGFIQSAAAGAIAGAIYKPQL
jgi:hypothetical protein